MTTLRSVRGLCGALVVCAGFFAANHASAQSSATLVSPELSKYLSLKGEQVKALVLLQRESQAELMTATKQAALLKAGPELAALCERTKASQAQAQVQAKAVLTQEQLSRLDSLQEAYAKMPLIEAAQRLDLLASDLKAPPLVLSQGTMELSIRYVRSEPVVLPGCSPANGHPFATQKISAN